MQVQSIFEAVDQGILLCDEKACILYFNSSYSKFIGRNILRMYIR